MLSDPGATRRGLRQITVLLLLLLLSLTTSAFEVRPQLGQYFCGYVDWGADHIPVIVEFNNPENMFIFRPDDPISRGFYVIQDPQVVHLYQPVKIKGFGLVGSQIISWTKFWPQENCYELNPPSDPPTALPPTDIPPTAVPRPNPAVFVYPVHGQELGYSGDYLFMVEPMDGVDGFLWSFFQDGGLVWENQRDEGSLSSNQYGIYAQTAAHDRFHPGNVEVVVYVIAHGQWSEASSITILLVDDTPPTPTQPVVDPNEVRQWLHEKRLLTMSLENATIPTRIFEVPALRAYDESKSRAVVDQLSAQLDQSSMSLDQFERLKRLTIQERMMQQMLTPYIETSSAFSKTSIDLLKTVFSFKKRLYLVWEKCDGFICGKLQEAANKVAWDLIQMMGSQFIKSGVQNIGTFDQISLAWETGILEVQRRVDNSSSPLDLLYDTGAEFAMTNLLIQPYLIRTQKFVDQGVNTVMDPSQGDVFIISGDAERAIALTTELVQKARWESDLAVSRYNDFQNTADLAQMFLDLTDLASVANPLIASVNLWARVEKLFLNTVSMGLSLDNMGCIEYLSSRGAEIAFNAAQPAEDCRYRKKLNLFLDPTAKIATLLVSARKTALHTAFFQTSQVYQQTLQNLVAAVQGGDQPAIESALQQFIDSQKNLTISLQNIQTILGSHERLSPDDITAISQSIAFNANNLTIYLALAENLTAREANISPEADLEQISWQALSRLGTVEQAIQKVDLSLPAGKPIVVIRDPEFSASNDGMLSLRVSIQNIGETDATNLALILEGGPTSQTKNISLPASDVQTLTFDALPVDQALFTIRVYFGGEVVDFLVVSPPDQVSNLTAPSITLSVTPNETGVVGPQPTVASPLLSRSPLTTSVIVLGCTGVSGILLIFGVLFIVSRTRSVKKH